MKVFDSVPVRKPNKNVFNLSHDVKSSYNFDKLYPFFCHPIYPGDTFNCRAEVFLRAMPLLCPVMHNVDMHLWFFFIPNRLVWNETKKTDWKTFITGGEDGKQRPTVPFFTYLQAHGLDPDFIGHGSLLDHLGFPTVDDTSQTVVNGTLPICSLPLRAYQLVYNEYFRNQNVTPEIEFSYGPGQEQSTDLSHLLNFRYKAWEKDYFTSALPFLQRGNAMTLPISGTQQATGTLPVVVNSAKLGTDPLSYGLTNAVGNGDNVIEISGDTGSTGRAVSLEGTATVSSGSLTFTGLSIGTINDFRYCLRLQQWMENNARCGSRYIEQLFAHFGVRSSDARLQRPELLGGGKIPLIFSDIPQTSYGQGANDDVLGDLGGKGTMYGKTSGFKKYFEEHGILLGILSIIPRTSYQQGVPRYWTAFDKEDWYFPEFAHLGEQAVLNKELYYDPLTVPSLGKGPDDVFGYQGRFTELRYIPSTVHGEMRGDLHYWHFGRIFPSLPVLNTSFVQAQSQVDSFAMSDVASGAEDPFIAQIHLDVKAVRPLPKYAVPTL